MYRLHYLWYIFKESDSVIIFWITYFKYANILSFSPFMQTLSKLCINYLNSLTSEILSSFLVTDLAAVATSLQLFHRYIIVLRDIFWSTDLCLGLTPKMIGIFPQYWQLYLSFQFVGLDYFWQTDLLFLGWESQYLPVPF